MLTIDIKKIDARNIDRLIFQILPVQGSIEVQRDAPLKEHAWHKHEKDETIIVIDGSFRFYSDEGERVCGAGDVINLPAGTPHGSQALEDGAVYLIASSALQL